MIAETHHAAHRVGQGGGVRELAVRGGLLVDAARQEDLLRGEGLLQRRDGAALGVHAHSKLRLVDPDRGSH